MENFNKLVPLRDECEKNNKVSDDQWKQAQSFFRILGASWCTDISEETAAFGEIMTAHTDGQFRHDYW